MAVSGPWDTSTPAELYESTRKKGLEDAACNEVVCVLLL